MHRRGLCCHPVSVCLSVRPSRSWVAPKRIKMSSKFFPIYLQQFPRYSNRKCKKTPFSRTDAHIFVSPGDAPGAVTLNVVWMEREFDAYKLSRCMCQSNYYHFWDTSRYFLKKSSFYHTPLAFDAPVRGFPSEYWHPLWDGKTRMVSLPEGEKISKICLFVLTWSMNVTDGQTDTMRDSIVRACIASRGKNRTAFAKIMLKWKRVQFFDAQCSRQTDGRRPISRTYLTQKKLEILLHKRGRKCLRVSKSNLGVLTSNSWSLQYFISPSLHLTAVWTTYCAIDVNIGLLVLKITFSQKNHKIGSVTNERPGISYDDMTSLHLRYCRFIGL